MVIGQQGSFFEIIRRIGKVEGAECHCHGIYFEIHNLDYIGQHPLQTNFHDILEY